jgi:hypothetical protein
MTLNIQDSSFRLAGARGTLSFLLPFVTFGTAGNAIPQGEGAAKSIITLAIAVFKFFLSFPANIYFTSTHAPVRTVTAQSEQSEDAISIAVINPLHSKFLPFRPDPGCSGDTILGDSGRFWGHHTHILWGQV